MKKGATIFLRGILLLIALVVLIYLSWFPQAEGIAAHVDLISIYTNPFIIYIYVASIPFFIGLYQANKLINLIDANKAFSQGGITTLKYMKFASISLIISIIVAELYIRFFAHGDDPAGPTMLGIGMILLFGVIATVTGIFQRLFQQAVDIKAENELTV